MQSYPRQNGLALALRELGRIERTLFTLDWLQSVELRRRVHARVEQGRGPQCAGPCTKPNAQALVDTESMLARTATLPEGRSQPDQLLGSGAEKTVCRLWDVR